MRKVLFWMLFLMFSGTVSVNAQVRIGAIVAPEKGAVLDLKSSASAPGYVGGLLLPLVELSDLNTVPDTWVGSESPDLDVSLLKGLLVYNTNTTLGTGIYVWDGAKWSAILTA
jgi:uncharacterized membrane protein YkgB